MSRPRVIVTERVSEKGMAILEKELDVTYRDGRCRENLLEVIGEYDARILRSVAKDDKELVNAAKRLRVV